MLKRTSLSVLFRVRVILIRLDQENSFSMANQLMVVDRVFFKKEQKTKVQAPRALSPPNLNES